MNRVRKQIGYETAAMQHLTGKQIGIGVLDSGIFLHTDLRECCEEFKDFVNGVRMPYDDLGHGTHICGIIAGSGRACGGYYQGLAPSCRLYVGKILDRNGDGMIETIIHGMEWLLDLPRKANLRVINISVSSFAFRNKMHEKLLFDLFREAYEKNILVVVAAGNQGPKGSSISRLGDTVHTICVGCHDGDYFADDKSACKNYSGRGPGNEVYLKPDIVAPGTRIVSCKNIDRQYAVKSGTSMAAPIVTGSLALAWQKYAGDTSYEMKRRLLRCAQDLGENYPRQGFGMVDLRKLLTGHV